MQVSDFGAQRPIFDPTQFFAGRTRSTGVLETRGGAPKQIVRTQTRGRWEGETLRLEQDLEFGTAPRQHRSWAIRKLDAHHYQATANDVVGTAVGEAYGNVFHWSFTLALSPGNRSHQCAHESVDVSTAGRPHDAQPHHDPEIWHRSGGGDGRVPERS